jgi:hypothetical protein
LRIVVRATEIIDSMALVQVSISARFPPMPRRRTLNIDASTGALVRVLSAQQYEFVGPEALALSGPDVMVVSFESAGSGAVTDLDAGTCRCTVVVSGPKYGFDDPDAIVVDGTEVFVANSGDGSVTEFSA